MTPAKAAKDADTKWTMVRLPASVSEPGVTESIVSLSWFAVPGSITIVSPAVKPTELATVIMSGCGTFGVASVFHGLTG